MQLIVILLVLIIVLLAGLASFLFFSHKKTQKTIDLFFEQGKIKDLREIFFEEVQKTKEVQRQLKEAFDKITALENSSKVSLQKIGVVRFNPFSNMGGNQSFTIALLDQQNNGFVLSSLFIKEGNRVYAKQVVKGKSEHVLSDEEQEAINRAIKNND